MGVRALIIDKDEDVAGRLADALIQRGYEVDVCATGRDGIDRARETMPGVIVLCVELEDTSGYSVCAKMKKDPDLRPIPLVITSEKATQETFEHHKKLKTRAQLYLMKPFDPEALAEDIAGLTGAGAASDEETTGSALDEAIASLSHEPPPLPDDIGIEGVVALPDQAYDEDDVRTTIGQMPEDEPHVLGSADVVLEAMPTTGGTGDLPHDQLVRRMKEAERARDEAVAEARAIEAQLKALAEGASQLPASSGATREVLAVKRELNAKERELLELREGLQTRDRQLLDAREREAELEERVVQSDEARAEADRARIDAEGRIAGAEARAEEIDRSSRAAIEERDAQIEAGEERVRALEGEVARLEGDVARFSSDVAQLEEDVAHRDATIETRDGRIGELEGTVERLEGDLDALRDVKAATDQELAGTRETLEETRSELEATRAALSDTEDRLTRALQRIGEDEDIRGKARQALEITLNLLSEADYAEAGGAEAEDGEAAAGPSVDIAPPG